MLRLSNGDFHALVLAEAVEDGRIIAPDQQRQVPISLPHQVLYGCYLDDRAVRLILNIFSLAVHFEKTEVRELIASLAPPVELPPVVRSAPEVLLPKEAVPEQPEQAPLVPLPVVPRAVEERPTDAGEARGVDERKQRDEAMARAAAAARALEAGRKEQEEAERRAAEKAREQERTAGEARKKAEREAAEQAEEAKRKAEAEVRRRAEEQERSRAEAEAREKTAQEARQREEEERRRYEEEQLRREEERKAAAERLAQEQERLAGAARRAEQERHAAAARLSTDTAQPPAVPAKGGRKHAIAVAVLVIAAVIAMVLLMPKSATPPEKRPAPVAETAKKEPEAPSREPAAPLVLNVPTSMPKPETVVYVVVKGDTLWGISKRFTGNPFNYPRVAKDNSIATPDLIFPGQKIQLVQEK